MSSKEAYENGADFIVVGRPITQADNIKRNYFKLHIKMNFFKFYKDY